ncbi:MAG: glycosyltransferase family 4 protein [Flavobacteriales bacterium]
MRIALCTDGIFPQAMGGMQRHSRLLAEHLARTGEVELVVLHPHAPGVFDPSLGIIEVPVAPIDTDKLYLRELWRYSGRVAAELDRIRPDVVLAQGFSVWKGGERSHDRLIVHPHGLEMFQGLTRKERLLGWPFRWALRRVLRQASACISLGGKLTDILREQVKGTACRVVVLPNAVEVPAVPAPFPPVDGPLDLLFVGRFAFNKGIDVLVAVADRLVKEGRGGLVRFSLAGDGPLLADYQAKGLPANIRLLGRVDDARLQQLYIACHAFVLPTRFEGMPTVVLEAMAQARPIFVSDVGATAELVGPHNGYLLPPGDADALYNAIIAFAERSPEVHAKMGRYSYERAAERFSWPAVTQGFLDVFRTLAAR